MTTFRNHEWLSAPTKDPGHRCKGCGSFVKIYARGLSSSMAKALIELYRLRRRARELNPAQKGYVFFHVRDSVDLGLGAVEISKLVFWGLVREGTNTDPTKRSSGWWAITPFGDRFVRSLVEVPKYVILSKGAHLVSFAGPAVSIKDCLGSRFNYQELMTR